MPAKLIDFRVSLDESKQRIDWTLRRLCSLGLPLSLSRDSCTIYAPHFYTRLLLLNPHTIRSSSLKLLKIARDNTSRAHVLLLPEELWIRIFSFVGLHHRPINLALTCQRMYGCVEQELWSRIVLNEEKLGPRLKDLLSVSKTSPGLGSMVRGLEILKQ